MGAACVLAFTRQSIDLAFQLRNTQALQTLAQATLLLLALTELTALQPQLLSRFLTLMLQPLKGEMRVSRALFGIQEIRVTLNTLLTQGLERLLCRHQINRQLRQLGASGAITLTVFSRLMLKKLQLVLDLLCLRLGMATRLFKLGDFGSKGIGLRLMLM